MNTDYIPGSDDAFNDYANKFVPAVTANPASFGLTANAAAALSTAAGNWTKGFGNFKLNETAFHTSTTTKDDLRGVLEPLIRSSVAVIQADVTVTDSSRTSAGVPIRKTTRTAAGTPTTIPMFQKVDTSVRGVLNIFVADSTTPEKRAKPAGVGMCEFREQIGGTAPVDPNAMPFLASVGRTPYAVNFEPTDVGKAVYFAVRWVSTTGATGPWSAVIPALIPG